MSLRRFALYFLTLAACAVAVYPRLSPVAASGPHSLSPTVLAAFQAQEMPVRPQPSFKPSRHRRQPPAFALLAGRD